MNVKELFENEELMNNIVEDIEDIPEDAEVTYEVWALGYDEEDNITDVEFCLESFDTLDSALTYLKTLTLEDVIMNYGTCHDDTTNEDLVDVEYFTLEIETVVNTSEDGTTNLGTVYQRDLQIDGEYGYVEDAEPTIFIYSKDYEFLKDGTIKVRRELLKDYNKNDCVKLCFAEEEPCTLTYKIISKVEYTDGDYYHLDFIG